MAADVADHGQQGKQLAAQAASFVFSPTISDSICYRAT